MFTKFFIYNQLQLQNTRWGGGIPEFQKARLSFAKAGKHLHAIYIVFTTLYIVFTRRQVI